MTRGHYIQGNYPLDWPQIAARVKEAAGWRCERCGHPNEKPWKTAHHDYRFRAEMDFFRGSNAVRWMCRRCKTEAEGNLLSGPIENLQPLGQCIFGRPSDCLPTCTHSLDGKQRMLTVDHLDGDKSNCQDWNLAALCQVCHLQIQGKVRMEQFYAFEQSDWMKPHVEGMHAWQGSRT